jgi:hypothetical protein
MRRMLFGFVRRGGENGAKAAGGFSEPRINVIGQLLIEVLTVQLRNTVRSIQNGSLSITPCLNAERKQVRGGVHDAFCCSSRYVARNFQHSSNEISDR